MENNENRLVPATGRPPNLGKLRKLAYGKPSAAGRPTAALSTAIPPILLPAKARRLRRIGPAWEGALVLGAVVLTVVSFILLDRGGALGIPARTETALSLPDAGLSPGDREKYWTLAGYETGRFAGLFGVRWDEPARMEEDARKPERLLSNAVNSGPGSGRTSRPDFTPPLIMQ